MHFKLEIDLISMSDCKMDCIVLSEMSKLPRIDAHITCGRHMKNFNKVAHISR